MQLESQVCAACERGDVKALQRWFPDGPTEWRSSWGYSLLHYGVQTPHVPVLDWVLTFPFDINEPTDHGTTPLMWACYGRQHIMARQLLAQGADLQATNPSGWTALHYACIRNWVDGVTWLLEQGADPEARDRYGRLPENILSMSSPHHATLRARLDAARQGCGLK
jgi:palmitoyltransferase ZDHHC13/17